MPVRVLGLGLFGLRLRSRPGECPFCGDPIAPRVTAAGRAPLTCKAPECDRAYYQFYGRSRRMFERVIRDARGVRESANRLIALLEPSCRS